MAEAGDVLVEIRMRQPYKTIYQAIRQAAWVLGPLWLAFVGFIILMFTVEGYFHLFGERFIAIESYGRNTCGVRRDGSVRCWGITSAKPPSN